MEHQKNTLKDSYYRKKLKGKKNKKQRTNNLNIKWAQRIYTVCGIEQTLNERREKVKISEYNLHNEVKINTKK